MKRLLVIAALLVPVAALAETFTWDAPATRTDGTPIDPAKDIKSYKFYRGSGLVAGNIPKPTANVAPPTTFEWTVPAGTNSYWVTAVDMTGVESAASNKRTIVATPVATPTPVVPTPAPLAPLAPPQNFDTLAQ